MHKRSFGTLAVAALAGLAGAWLYWGLPAAELALKQQAETRLSAAAGLPVSVREVRVHPLLLSAALIGPRVGPAEPGGEPLFACERWTFRVSPLRFTPTYPWFALALGHSTLEKPVLRVPAAGGRNGFPAALTARPIWLVHHLEWNGGELHAPAAGRVPALALADASGFVRVTPQRISVLLKGRSEFGPAEFSARLDGARWTASASLQKLDLAALGRLDARLEGRAAGEAAVRLSAKGALGEPRFEWNLAGSVRRGVWRAGAAEAPFEGAFALSPGALALEDARVFGLAASGTVERPFDERRLDLELKGADVDLAEFRQSLPAGSFPAGVPLHGRGALSVRLRGTAADPQIALSLDASDARLAGVALPSLRATASYAGGSAEGAVELLHGRAAFSRTAEDGAWSLSIRNLDLAEAAKTNGWGRVAGSVNGQFRARGGLGEDLSADGSLRIDRFAWGVHQETAPIAGRLTVRGGKLSARGPDDVLRLDAEISGDRVELSRFSFELPSGLSLSASGSVELAGGGLAVQGAVRRVPLREVPMLLSRYPEIEGEVDFDGALSGTLREPSFIGRGKFAGVRLRAGAAPSSAEATLRWGLDGFSLSRLDVDGAWKGEGRWTRGGAWSLDFAAESAPAALPADVLRLPAGEAAGRLTGRLRLSGGPDAPPSGEAEVVWKNGRWKGFEFQEARGRLTAAAGEASLRGAEVRQSSGVWQADGSASLRPGGPFQVVFQFKNFAAGPLALDGEVSAKGSAQAGGRLEGELRSPNFWVNGFHVGAFDARLAASRESIALTALRAAGLPLGDLSADLAARTVKGRLQVRDLPLSDWSVRLKGPASLFTGKLTASADVSGPWNAPKATFTGAWTGGDWKGFAFDSTFRGQWDQSALRLHDWTAVLPEGGRARARGTVSFAGVPAADLALELSKVPLHALAESAGWSPPWRGDFDAKLAWTGSPDDPVLTGEVSGREVRSAEGPLLTEWSGRLRYAARELRFEELSARTPEGVWRVKEGSRAIFAGEGRGHLHLVSELRNIHAGPLSLFGGLELTGQWRAPRAGDGAAPRPSLECTVRAQSLWVNQQRFDQDLARLAWSGNAMTFTPVQGALQRISGEVRFDAWPQVKLLDLSFHEGNARRFWIHGEAGPHRWDFELHGDGLESKTLIGLADLDLPMEGALNVRLKGQGSPKEPRVEGDVSGQQGRLGRLPYDRVSAHVLWDGPSLHVSGLEAAGRGRYVLRGEGRLPVALEDSDSDDFAFSLRLTDGDLRLLEELWPHCRSAQGSFRGELHFKPRRDGTHTSGFLIVEKGRIRADRYFSDLNDFNARLLVKDNRLVFENFSLRLGTGRLWVQGDLGLRGFDVTDYNLSIESVGRPGVEIEVPQLAVPPGAFLKRFSLLRESLENVTRGRPLVYLKVTGPDGDHSVLGTIVLEDTNFTYPPAKKIALARDSWLREFWSEASWDVDLKMADDTWYRNEFVNVKMDGALRIFGRQPALKAEGKLASERGVISYLGQSYRVKQGAFEVVTDTRAALADRVTIPYLSVVAERSAMIPDSRGVPTPDVITMIVARKPLGEIQPKFVSRNRPDWESDVVVRKTFGITEDQVTPAEKDQLLRAGLVQLLGSTAGPLAGRIAQRFGIDILYPTYERPELAGTPGAQAVASPNSDIRNLLQGTGASAGVQLSNRVFGLYKFTVDQALSQNQLYFRDELELIYRVGGNLHLRASTELDSEKLLGQPPNRQAVLENQWRFGQPKKKASGAGGQTPPEPAR